MSKVLILDGYFPMDDCKKWAKILQEKGHETDISRSFRELEEKESADNYDVIICNPSDEEANLMVCLAIENPSTKFIFYHFSPGMINLLSDKNHGVLDLFKKPNVYYWEQIEDNRNAEGLMKLVMGN